MEVDEKAQLQAEIVRLTQELAERQRLLPAHSIRPHQIQAIESLEEAIREKTRQLESLCLKDRQP